MSLSTIPRPVIFALIGGVLLLGIFMFMRKGSSDSSSKLASPPPARETGKPGSAGGGTATSPPGSKSTGKTPSQTGSGSTSGSTDKSASTPQAPGGKNGLPASVQKALDQHKVVVILFWRPVGVDDQQVYDSVQGLRGRSDAVRVFTTNAGDIDRYVSITGADGITQTPALLVINRNGKSDVQTGFLDEKTIENTVYNAISR